MEMNIRKSQSGEEFLHGIETDLKKVQGQKSIHFENEKCNKSHRHPHIFTI